MSLTLEQTLASILQSLANFFGVTTQTIMENAPMWLAKYGWYVTVKDLGFNIFVGVFIGAIISSIIWFILKSILKNGTCTFLHSCPYFQSLLQFVFQLLLALLRQNT